MCNNSIAISMNIAVLIYHAPLHKVSIPRHFNMHVGFPVLMSKIQVIKHTNVGH